MQALCSDDAYSKERGWKFAQFLSHFFFFFLFCHYSSVSTLKQFYRRGTKRLFSPCEVLWRCWNLGVHFVAVVSWKMFSQNMHLMMRTLCIESCAPSVSSHPVGYWEGKATWVCIAWQSCLGKCLLITCISWCTDCALRVCNFIVSGMVSPRCFAVPQSLRWMDVTMFSTRKQFDLASTFTQNGI